MRVWGETHVRSSLRAAQFKPLVQSMYELTGTDVILKGWNPMYNTDLFVEINCVL